MQGVEWGNIYSRSHIIGDSEHSCGAKISESAPLLADEVLWACQR